MPELERARAPAMKLHAELDSTRTKRDEACNDAEGTALAKQDLKQSLEEAKREATIIHLKKLDAANASRLSSELGAAKAEVATLQDWVVCLDAKEAELSSKLESS
ncbi:hypothetical protein ACLOJK_018344 [Asimina triloba]